MRNTVVVVMLGMNRLTQRDTSHPFDMRCLDGYNVMWLPQVSKLEKSTSSLFYEVGKAMDEVRTEFTEVKDKIVFVMGRGTIGDDPEDSLAEALLEATRTYGKDALRIVVGKSYGAVDSLRAYRQLAGWNQLPKTASMMLIDGYAPRLAMRHITKRYDRAGRRFVRPQAVKRLFTAVQRTNGFEGLMAGPPKSLECSNFVVKQEWIDENCKWYDHYADGYRRRLKACHKHMEEIVSVVPSFNYRGAMRTLPELVKMICRQGWT